MSAPRLAPPVSRPVPADRDHPRGHAGRGRGHRRGHLRRRNPDHRGAAEFARAARQHQAAGEAVRRADAGRRRHSPHARPRSRTFTPSAAGSSFRPTSIRRWSRAAVQAGMVACPGYFTPTEAFAALDAGATALKLFPAEGGVSGCPQGAASGNSRRCAGNGRRRHQARQYAAVARCRRVRLRPRRRASTSPGQSAEETLDKARAYVAGLAR